ncbi:recombinase family protein [Streptomyces phaeochromogenes]|uniref:recombinase family protein n=1 Tax=Streptomyces phaeochromogenes TaxID=1923 RepID=UPI0033E2F8D7
MTNSQVRAVIYTRISSDPTGNAGGVTRQEEACRKLAADLGWRVVGVKVDDDLTAIGKGSRRAQRPGYTAVLDMLTAREADAVIVWHTDRLYRQARDLEPLIEIVDRTHAVIRPVQQGELDLATASGRMVARILASVSTHEVEHAIERMKDKKAANRRSGVHSGGPRPFGFKPVRKTPRGEPPEIPQLDPREAKLIADAAEALLAHAADPQTGLSLAGVCRQWNARKVTTPRGNPWTISALKKVMTSARLPALIEFEGEIVGPAQWDAILDRTTWQALRTVLRDPARSVNLSPGHGARVPKYLGSGIYGCHCGGSINPGGSRVGTHPRYRCTEHAHLSRRADLVDDLVERVIVARLREPDARDLFTPSASTPVAGLSVEALTARHAALTARLEALAETFADDDESDPVEYRAASRKIKERITAVEQEIADAQTQAAAAREPGPLDDVDLPELTRRHVASPDDALKWWRASYSLDRRRRILKALAVVTLVPGKQGRPPGWKPGTPYFDPESVEVDWTPRTA